MSNIPKIKVLAGFDAFVDRIFHLVQNRNHRNHYERMETLQEFAQRVSGASGHSANVERVLQRTKAGGNAALFALCASSLEADVNVLAPVGFPEIHPEFSTATSRIRWHNLGQPGFTDALEFRDGKIMLNETGDVANIGMAEILAALGEDVWNQMRLDSDVILLGNWTMNLGMKTVFDAMVNSKWDGFRGFLFLDLADPRKRSRADLQMALEQVKQMGRVVPVILGLNLSEANQVLECFGKVEDIRDEGNTLEGTSQWIVSQIGCGVVIHGIYHAAACVGGISSWVAGPYCSNPTVTTGAGDHFNAGFALSLASKFPLSQSLEAGVRCSGFYVKEGRAPSWDELGIQIP